MTGLAADWVAGGPAAGDPAAVDWAAGDPAAGDPAAVDAEVAASAEAAFCFLERLVAAPSTVGAEQAAQDLLAGELDRAGFAVTRLDVPEQTAAGPPGGVAQASYAGRRNVLGRLNPGRSPSLLLNGHIDVVPARAQAWSADPFVPRRAGGWLAGRGAGDMMSGFAMGLQAIGALCRAMPGALTGEFSLLSVIEEECTGNGTLAACNVGVLGDAVVLLEPTGLDLLLGGTGILWVEIEIAGVAAHAGSADLAPNPVSRVPAILRALRDLEAEINAAASDPALSDPAFSEVAGGYNVNVGTVPAGDWPSSVPARALLGVRLAFPRAWTPEQALDRVRAAAARAADGDPWLAAHPPAVRPSGFRAEGYLLAGGHPLAAAMAAAHASAHGAEPRRVVLASTTDARYYLNQFGRPAIAYGPVARDIHGTDEAVELASIVAGARTLARFIAGFFAGDGPQRGSAAR